MIELGIGIQNQVTKFPRLKQLMIENDSVQGLTIGLALHMWLISCTMWKII